ncbi:S8 family serine peptidase [Sphingomonas sp. BT-65]|uniref:S8 family serine peptidase n=1 Tax=Sphingomonas sp. BT-65 TaxID=2989821 RepID=UPI002235A57D|nr:S8 family serine peptidase [Sphingomonas sp. BT-65]MCW4462707.1 S8 family serine peptidase [Sphingomonas sp. BT-65]
MWIARIIAGGVLLLALPGSAQLLPQLPSVPQVGGVVDRVTGGLDRTLDDARSLAMQRVERMRELVRRHPDRIAIDPEGNAVRARELVMLDADRGVIDAAAARGFRLIEQVDLDGLGVGYARFETPRGVGLERALRALRKVAGGREVSADPLYFASGSGSAPAAPVPVAAQAGVAGRIGIIDGGVRAGTPGLAAQQGFAAGAPRPNDHAAAIASLLTGGSEVRASAPGAQLHVADIYGSDPAGASAAALGQALAWMVRQKVPVVVVSLTGPPNPLLARVIAAARRLDTVVVAAVGNDGPAAPPAYPASYAQAIAVTGTDARARPLIEAGRALKIDYAAPGADLLAADAGGRATRVRGTSYAAPFVAARLSAHLGSGGIDAAIRGLDGEARDMGKRGTDKQFGRGLICGECATRPR